MEADISTWRKTGHFYLALTRAQVASASPFTLSSAKGQHLASAKIN
jgi:hypothetical protein